MKATLFRNAEELAAFVKGPLGTSSWVEITQAQIDQFAEATGDHQWIHVDPERAKDGPFGKTVAHGYLTLALASRFLFEVLAVHARVVVNYGVERVRFPAPVKVGSRVRGNVELVRVETMKDGSSQATVKVTTEIEGHGKPACVAEILFRYYF
ncbi:MAG TPA: MaoC family dehydratase [Nevskiaceae bacterium]